ncbi:MAG: hypothetical protein M1481_00770 [Candidatus Thermoplasmatota archaeon]|jgi:hypothetical protein|nr:hypothetical protein [Candidatus Thermoplasmatota archaeon]MCL5964153.1 hypothetical protein [Candidatus Thermoplasmatota archaeon]
MTLIVKRIKTQGDSSYYKLVDEKRVNGKVVTKYVGYLGKTPKSIQEITPEQILPYVRRLIDTGLTDVDLQRILKKMGVETDVWHITKIIIENDMKLKKLLIRFK